MNKKVIIIGSVIAVLLVIIVISGYLYWNWQKQKNAIDVEEAIEDSTKGVLPSLNINTNPLQDKPNVNPADAANPIKNIKINPFE